MLDERHWAMSVHYGTSVFTRHFFSNRVVNRWNLLDQQTADVPSLNAFKARLTRISIRDNTRWASLWTSLL